MLEEFRKFALRGNVVDLAIGIVIGAAFGNIVTSLVGDIFMPLVGAIMGVPRREGHEPPAPPGGRQGANAPIARGARRREAPRRNPGYPGRPQGGLNPGLRQWPQHGNEAGTLRVLPA